MRRDTTMEEFWIFQDSEYDRGLHMRALDKVLNMCKYGWIMPYDKVLYMSGLRLTGFQISFWFYICQGSEYDKIVNMRVLHWVLNMP